MAIGSSDLGLNNVDRLRAPMALISETLCHHAGIASGGVNETDRTPAAPPRPCQPLPID